MRVSCAHKGEHQGVHRIKQASRGPDKSGYNFGSNSVLIAGLYGILGGAEKLLTQWADTDSDEAFGNEFWLTWILSSRRERLIHDYPPCYPTSNGQVARMK